MHELGRHLGPRDFSKNMILSLNCSGGVRMNPMVSVPDNFRSQRHECRSRGANNAAFDIKVDDGPLQLRLIRHVNQVRTPGERARASLDFAQSGGNYIGILKPARSIESSRKPAFASCDNHAGGGNTARHLANHIGESAAMRFGESPVAQPLGVKGRLLSQNRKAINLFGRLADPQVVRVFNDVKDSPDIRDAGSKSRAGKYRFGMSSRGNTSHGSDHFGKLFSRVGISNVTLFISFSARIAINLEGTAIGASRL